MLKMSADIENDPELAPSPLHLRGTYWSVTINNPTNADDEAIHVARSRGWKVEGQKEVGESGTPHYQLMVHTPQVRWTAVRKQFPRGHVELAKNPIKLRKYVSKEETRVGSLPKGNELYPSQSKTYDLVTNYFYERNYVHADGDKWWDKEARGRDALDLWDEAIGHLIYKGYFVEVHGVNPQVRGAFKRWCFPIMMRSLGSLMRDAEENVTIETYLDAPSVSPPQASSPSPSSHDAEEED